VFADVIEGKLSLRHRDALFGPPDVAQAEIGVNVSDSGRPCQEKGMAALILPKRPDILAGDVGLNEVVP
ncbi:MAG: hypothetical protein ACXWG5_10920, partial [Candidatus Aminicenantales bacterium]